MLKGGHAKLISLCVRLLAVAMAVLLFFTVLANRLSLLIPKTNHFVGVWMKLFINQKIIMIIFSILLFPTITLAIPLQKILRSQIAQDIRTIGSSNNFLLPTTMALGSQSQFTALGHLITIPIYAYNPALGVATTAALGYLDKLNVDAEKAHNSGVFKRTRFDETIRNLFKDRPVQVGDIIGGMPGSAPPPGCSGVGQVTGIIPHGSSCFSPDPINYWADCTHYHMYELVNRTSCGYPGYAMFVKNVVVIQPSTGEDIQPTYPPTGAPETVTREQAEKIAKGIADAIVNDPSLKDHLVDIIKQNPQIVTYPQNITQNDVDNYLKNQINNSTTNYNNTLNDIKNNNTSSVEVQIEIAKEQQRQAEKEKEEIDFGRAVAPTLPAHEIKEVDFKPIKDLAGELSGKFPFSGFGLISDCVSPLCAQPVAPVLKAEFGEIEFKLDFSILNSFAKSIRDFMSFFMWCATVYFIVFLYSRM